jgi:2-keto-4-pentenoate hydratase/2-oxohepta-3-ene-1,7-dioic acid hydratase in catechol pathway
MHHRFEDILAHVSADETLHAGEFFGSGTVGGGCGLEQGRFLNQATWWSWKCRGWGCCAIAWWRSSLA